jgi:hypothetical protein
MKQSSKKATKKTTKKAARKSAMPKAAAKKQAAKRNGKATGKQSGKKRRSIKSTVPPQFRVLPRLGEANDPRFWELRREFKDYFKSLPDEEAEAFIAGLEYPFVDYLALELTREEYLAGRRLD